METRVCKDCRLALPLSDFRLRTRRYTEGTTYTSRGQVCHPCELARRRAHRNRNANPEWRERENEKRREWRRKNRKRHRLKSRKYRAQRRARLSAWCQVSQDNALEIEMIYEDAVHLPGFEVDHIVPLHGDNVCGLHVPWNLQIVPAAYNRAKGKKEWF